MLIEYSILIIYSIHGHKVYTSPCPSLAHVELTSKIFHKDITGQNSLKSKTEPRGNKRIILMYTK